MLGTIMRRIRKVSLEQPKGQFLRCAAARYQSTDQSSKSGLSIETNDQVLWLRFARPEKFNAITRDMYIQLTDTFKKANSDKSIKTIVLTGTGDYYSSGNDLSNFTAAMKHPEGFKMGLKVSADILYDFVDSLINLEKFLIAAVNGPAVGIPVTTLPLCDFVIASDKATFQTPFTALGQCPEACSSFTMPAILGKTRASELLMLNMTWDAKKAKEYGLVSDVVAHEKFGAYLGQLTKTITKSCYTNSMFVSKSIVQSPDMKQKLVDTNRRECDAILELWAGDECMDAVQKFFNRSKK